MTLNKEIFQRDPTTFSIPNDGVTTIAEPRTDEQWAVLRYELESFVCEGEYAAGMERVLSTFLTHLGQPVQPAVWVSGFYGSGKSHLVRVLRYLWQDPEFPDGARARSLRSLPKELDALLRELSTAGRREGGLWAAAGKMEAGQRSIRLSVIGILFEAAGLPVDYAQGRFVLWLREEGLYDAVVAGLQSQGTTMDDELPNMNVSTALAQAVSSAEPRMGDSPAAVLASLRAQFPRKDDITESEMLQAIDRVLRQKSDTPGKLPLTLVVLDELQQSIGEDSDRTLQVQGIVEACTTKFRSQLLFVATGQSALADRPQLSKLRDRFTVLVTLSDQDVHRVLRQVVLLKKSDREPELRQVLDKASGEIHRHLSATRIAHTQSDDKDLVPDYPLLPTRSRFWERLLRGIDISGTAAQLRTQLRVVWEATRGVADKPLGNVVAADVIYEQQKPSMLQRALLLPDLSSTIAALDDGTPDGQLRSRLCATIFLIQQLPTEGITASAVKADPDTLADLLVEDLTAGSAGLRHRIPALLDALVHDGKLMLVGGEYRLQTRESAEWQQAWNTAYQHIRNDDARLASDRSTSFKSAIAEALKGIKLQQGNSKTPRRYALHWGLDAPPPAGEEIPIWVRDAWNVSEKVVRNEAQAAGMESPVVFVFLPREQADALADALGTQAAADEVLASRAAQTTPESVAARQSMQTRSETARGTVNALVAEIMSSALVFQGGGYQASGANLREAVQSALEASLARLFPHFSMGDDARWATVVKRAGDGAADALSVLGYEGDAAQHPLCKEVLAYLGGVSRAGKEIQDHFTGAGYGWPRDAVDGALLVLLTSGHLEGLDKGHNSVIAKKLPQSSIGVVTFRAVEAPLSLEERIAVRGLLAKLGLVVKPGEEDDGLLRALDAMLALGGKAGGAPPLPALPDLEWLRSLQAESRVDRMRKAFSSQGALLNSHMEWTHLATLAELQRPRWDVLQRLLKHALSLPAAGEVSPAAEAIQAQRSLLADPDPVQPLVTRLVTDLRAALQDARQRLGAEREAQVKTLRADPAWDGLTDDDWRGIFAAHQVGPAPELAIGTEAELLNTLDARPLTWWSDQVDALPARMQAARDHAARLLAERGKAVSSVRVTPRPATLSSEAAVDAYLAELRTELLNHIADGKSVLI
ncbi:MAG: BREX system P-loop protein BrxC [Anaerolineales bacterium]|nr:BREX system P-loop protein BrxC [Anaerolineales bacterium]